MQLIGQGTDHDNRCQQQDDLNEIDDSIAGEGTGQARPQGASSAAKRQMKTRLQAALATEDR